MRTNVYVDGFNLYYGLLKGGPHKWLNLEALFDAVLPKNTIQTVRYFTAERLPFPRPSVLPSFRAVVLQQPRQQ